MNKILCLLVVVVTSVSCEQKTQQTSLTPEIIAELEQAEKAMFKSTSDGDSAAFRKICSKDFYTINANGEAQTLNEAVAMVPFFKGSRGEQSDQKQRIFGNVALRTGHMKINLDGQVVAEILYTSGWEYKDGRWQYMHWQGTMASVEEPMD